MTSEYLSPLANHLWQSSLFAVAAGLLTLTLRKHRASARYWLWLAASVKFLIPFSLLVSLGSQFEWRPATATAPTQLVSVVGQIGEPFAVSAAAALSTTPEAAPSHLPFVLFSVLLCGFVVIAFSWFREWKRLRTAMRAATPLDLNFPIRVLSSPACVEPGIVGIFRPVLLLPQGITDRLTTAQLQAILVHERCHVRRRDNLAAAIHMLVEAIFWFHPLVWWIENRLVDERERACDEEVLSVVGEPQVYAEGILNVCKFYKESSLVCVSGVTGSNLKKRMESIMTPRIVRELRFGTKLLLAFVGMAAVAGPIVIGLLNAPEIRAASQGTPRPQFEVASLKMNTSDRKGRDIPIASHGRLEIQNWTMKQLIVDAYGLRDLQVSGLSNLYDSDRYDISARAGADVSETQMWLMVQNLLEDRFKLKYHHETRESPVYALVVGKNGPRLPKSAQGDCQEDHPALPFADWKPSDRRCGSFYGVHGGQGLVLVGSGVSMAGLALSLPTDRFVLDQTGLTDRYNVNLQWTPDDYNTLEGGPPGPSLSTALEEQLGLKLESTRGPVELFVIDHAERAYKN